ncbi:hypothetical protein F5879DRAFT_776370, partial [Lentinula edodes]
VPAISSRHQSTQPPPPDDLKHVSLSDPGELDSSKEYPVLILIQYTYWGKDCPSIYIDNRYAMAILAYDSSGTIVGRWSKQGARYVHHIEFDEIGGNVSFVGQGNLSVIFQLSEL